ncbi:LysM peptidoglycan-binding domain-containing protein [Bifidobacterium saimiriisciurei]|uniref:LysM peptidoglycan-binding domain-containing protein n=1 Tax=Bifidobacterium saimiriisciurei TaxID=2661627 RepID=UPI00298BEEB3|nr:LysM peptidoglycan-binding domain-containing protein [Bifidobacterium saimiriisciurei]
MHAGARWNADARWNAWRDRIVIAMLAVAMSCVAYSVAAPALEADSATGPMEVTCYTVGPGDTLWSYAQGVTPHGGNVNDTVDELMRLNQLDSPSLQVGQRIVVPARHGDA